MALFFIYGTLKKDFFNHHILMTNKGLFQGYVETKDKYPMFLLEEPFPYLQDDKGKGFHIKGELYEIKDRYIDNMDFFEGVPDLYYRDRIKVLKDNKEIDCYVYFKTNKINLDNIILIKEYNF